MFGSSNALNCFNFSLFRLSIFIRSMLCTSASLNIGNSSVTWRIFFIHDGNSIECSITIR